MDIYSFDNIINEFNSPENDEMYNKWIKQDELVSFLELESKDEFIIIYCSFTHAFINSAYIQNDQTIDEVKQDLLKWSCNPFSSWSLVVSSNEFWIESPLFSSNSEVLKRGEQILFCRNFDRINNGNTYYELNQKFTHLLEIHYLSERNAWCNLDINGDIEEVVKIIKIDLPRNQNGKIICAKRSLLEKYATMNKLRMIRMFDVSRFKSGAFSGWQNMSESVLSNSNSIFGKLSYSKTSGSFSRGIQFLEHSYPKQKIIDEIFNPIESRNEEKNCTFITHDWKNKTIVEVSCSLNSTASYFIESELPFQISPVFFRPEVLLKYKSDKDKYILTDRNITCKGVWSLKTFDVNTAGQVHTYIKYLGDLPYTEQLHWKQYNEPPKAPISERAMINDFHGEPYEGYDPLRSLKNKLESLISKGVDYWIHRDSDAMNRVNYPYTHSRDEWADEILNLDQLLIEGFNEKWLKMKAKELHVNLDSRFRSLKVIELILVTLGFEETHAGNIMSPFHTIHNLRSKLKGHATGTEAERIRKESISNYGSFNAHYKSICTDCDESLKTIIENLDKL
jgi:hypothetical protein